MNFNELTENIKKYKSNGNIKLIEKAYLFSKKAHEGQKRKSHDDYIMHPLNVAFILSELKLDETIIASALLHDVLEDTKITFNDLKKEFGEDIANVVEGETKISKLKYGDRENYQSESIRKMLIATTKDIRVIIVKLADRLDNMRSLKHLDKERQKRISKETLEVYAPLAYRLGIWKIKWELEDLSFKFLEPKIYLEIKNSISKKRDERERDVFRIVKLIKKELHRNKVDSNVFGRPKNFYGIYNKMKRKNIPFEEIYDLQGIRVITKDVKECYEVLGILHNKWKPIPNEFDDYIANPKPNLYQSIHTVVLIDKAKVEFQIRTEKMDSVAEEGIAAHWSYKNIKSNTKFEKSLGWLKQILHLKDRKGEDFLESLKVDLFGDNIFVFTPKGKIIELPKDSTPVDFAYSVHSDIGDKSTGARVNEKFVSLRYELHNNDIVEIITKKSQKPSRDWLKFVKSDKARQKIRQSIRELTKLPVQRKKIVDENLSKGSLISLDMEDAIIKIAKCCSPLPDDGIKGLSTRSKRVIIHKENCDSIKNIGQNKKKIDVYWNENINNIIDLKIINNERVGFLADLLNTIASTGKSVLKTRARTVDENFGESIISIEFSNLKDIKDVIKRIEKIADVKSVSLVL